MKNSSVALISILVALAWTSPVTAQQASGAKKMYRCGTNFQDKPCDGGTPAAAAPPAAKPAPAVASAAPAAKATAPAAPELTKVSAAEARAAQQKQIRCENFSRQATELRDRQKATPQYAESIGVQLKSLETRMNADGC